MRGERVLYFAFEESPDQFMRNMRSIGIDLQAGMKNGLLQFDAIRVSMYGLEAHLAKIYNLINQFQPDIVVMDPINAFVSMENVFGAKAMMVRLVDFLKSKGITALFVNLDAGCSQLEQNDVDISSLIDTWLQLRHTEIDGEHNLSMYIIKSRGMAHSKQVRKFILTDQGIDLTDLNNGSPGVPADPALQK